MTVAARNTRALQLAARREQFLAAAERMFLAQGFARTSVNAIVREAGGSLATLYAEFGTKEALFESVLSDRVSRFFPESLMRTATPSRDVETELRAFASHMLKRMLSEEGLSVYRIFVSEAPHFPGLRKAVLETGMPGLTQGTARYLGELAAVHALHIDDADLAASRFIALIQSQILLQAACGAHVDVRKRDLHITQAVRAFLTLYPAGGTRR